MRVLIFHGYLLRGTGSNVYNASLAAALAQQGHEVHLLCQEAHPPPVDERAPGSVTFHRPDIGGLLPVFVHDTYEGFEVKTFAELTDAELDGYIDANVRAVRDLVAELGGVDAALANHLVMGPVILSRAGLRYALKVHGSDLSYTVLPELDRFGPYAQEAVDGANGILVGSGHIAARLRQAVPATSVDPKIRLGPPGVDTSLFAPIPPEEREAALARKQPASGGAGRRPRENIPQRSEDVRPRSAFPTLTPRLHPGTVTQSQRPSPSTGSPPNRAPARSSSASSSSPRASTYCSPPGRSCELRSPARRCWWWASARGRTPCDARRPASAWATSAR